MKRLFLLIFIGLFVQTLAQFNQGNLLEAEYTPTYYRLEMNLNPYQSDFSGKTTMKFITTESTQEIKINAKENLNIENVSYHSILLNDYSRDGDVLKISLPENLPANQLDSISISFSGNASTSSGFMLGMHEDVPVIETLSEPWHASTWWVCKDDLIDKVDKIDVVIRHPSEFKAASNGVLQSVTDLGDGSTITHWQHNYAIPAYLVAVAVTNYVEYNHEVDINGTTVPIINYLYPESLDEWSDALDLVPSYMVVLSEKFGDYPFKTEKYGHAQWNRGGGMEHSTMSFMGKFTFNLIVHELAHQWFGNMVTCASWNDIWINEGFADYCTGILSEHFLGEEKFNQWKKERIDLVTAEDWGSVYVPEGSNQSRIFNSRLTYKKGSMMVHLIRYMLNDDELFYDVLNEFLYDSRFNFGYAGVEDFKDVLEIITHKNWDKFYDDWIYGEGHPILDVELNKESDSNIYTLNFIQTTSHHSVEFFEMPIEVEFIGNNQTEIRRFELNQLENSFSISDLPFEVSSFTVNPNFDIVCEINSAVLNTHDLTELKTKIYPNPSKGFFNIESNQKIVEVKVYDASGRLVGQWSGIDELNFTIQTSNWSNGVYGLKIRTLNNEFVEKLIVNN